MTRVQLRSADEDGVGIAELSGSQAHRFAAIRRPSQVSHELAGIEIAQNW
jgi:hypothetical protein